MLWKSVIHLLNNVSVGGANLITSTNLSIQWTGGLGEGLHEYFLLSWSAWYSSLYIIVFQRSSDLFDIVSYYIKWVTNSWTYSTVCPGSSDPFYIASLLYKMGHYFLDILYLYLFPCGFLYKIKAKY